MFSDDHLRVFDRVIKIGKELSTSVYLVGGAVRDLLVGRGFSDRDLDLVVEGDALRIAKEFSRENGGEVRAYPEFLTSKVTGLTDFGLISEIDFASARSEIYERPGKLPIVSAATISEDLKRRDFTINSLAVSIEAVCRVGSLSEFEAQVVDRFEGLQDLRNKTVRILHERSFLDDPTRLYRGCRYRARLSGLFDPTTEGCFKEALKSGALDTISNYRKFAEVRKMFEEESSKRALSLAADLGLIEPLVTTLNGDLKSWRNSFDSLVGFENQDSTSRYSVFLCLILVWFSSDPNRERLFNDLGVGRKGLKVLTQIIDEEASGVEPMELTLQSLLLRASLREGSDREGALDEIRVRKS